MPRLATLLLAVLFLPGALRATTISIVDGKWHLDGKITYPGTRAEGLLMNTRMVNATFEDRHRPAFDAEANTAEFIARLPDYVAQGIRAFTFNLQGGMPGYEGALNTAYEPDGALRPAYLARVERAIRAIDRAGAAVILGCFYQRQDQILRDDAAVRSALVNTLRWIEQRGFTNVVVEIANEYGHRGFDRALLKTHAGQAELLRLAKQTTPRLLVATSEPGGRGAYPQAFLDEIIPHSDFLLIHLNITPIDTVASRLARIPAGLKIPVVCNEDEKLGELGARSLELCVERGISWGYMLPAANQWFPFAFTGAADDPVVYAKFKALTHTPRAAPLPTPFTSPGARDALTYFPPAESKGGWRKLTSPDEVRRLGGMDPEKLAAVADWLRASDRRNFAATVIRHGQIVLEVERGNSAVTDARRVASVSKAVCATVLAIASELSRTGPAAKRMTFDDPAFKFIPWAQPLSDPRKARITIRQLFNTTSGLCPESTGAPNDGTWDYILGHSGDARTAQLAFAPGTASGYSTHALHHASLVCEYVTGQPYDQFALKRLYEPLGIEKHWFQFFDGSAKIGRHPTHAIGLPSRELARIAYCMLRGGKWGDRQVIPAWFVADTATASHPLAGAKELRNGRDAAGFSHAWERPTALNSTPEPWSEKIPPDARFKRGSGGQLIAFIPSLDLVITRQTGASGPWNYEEYIARVCEAVVVR